MLVHFDLIKQEDGTLSKREEDMTHIPRKGESIAIGTGCYLINDVIWHVDGNQVTLLLLRRNHPL